MTYIFRGYHLTHNTYIGEIFLDLRYRLKRQPGGGGRRGAGMEQMSSEEKGNSHCI